MSKLAVCRFGLGVAVADARCQSNVVRVPRRPLSNLKNGSNHKYLKRRSMSSSPTTHASKFDGHDDDSSYRASRPILITFDAFGTLYSPRQPVSQQYAEEARRFGLDVEARDIERVFKSSFKVMSQVHPNYGKRTGISYQDWWGKLIRIVFTLLNYKASDSLVDSLFHRFSTDAGYKIKGDVFRFLQDVSRDSSARGSSYTMLGVISNSDPRVESILSSHGIDVRPSLGTPRETSESSLDKLAPFSFVTLSYNCDVEKPDLKIYEAALQDAERALDHVRAEQGVSLPADVHKDFHHMHVGDDIQNDVLPALKSGWDAVLLDRRLNDSDVENRLIDGFEVPTIGSLAMLNKLVSQALAKPADGSSTNK